MKKIVSGQQVNQAIPALKQVSKKMATGSKETFGQGKSDDLPITKTDASKAGLYVSVLCGFGILATIALLAFHLSLVEQPTQLIKLSIPQIACTSQECESARTLLTMEENAQTHRASHIKSALSVRLMTYVLAEIIALVMIVMGGMLVFNRIEGGGEDIGYIQSEDGKLAQKSFFMTTAFPGVMLCLFGSLTLVSAMFLPTREAAKIVWKDAPVFHANPNSTLILNGLPDQLHQVDPNKIPKEFLKGS